MRRLARLSVIALISAAPFASAADNGPGSRAGGSGGGRGGPAGPNRADGNEGRGEGRDRGPGFRGRGGPGGSGFDKGFEDRLRAFLKDHAPNRYADIEKSQNAWQSSMESMGRRYGELLMLKNSPDGESQELYKNRVAQIESEDQEYGLLKQIAIAKKAGNADEQASLEEMLAAKAKDSVALRLKERQLRLAKFERFLAAEKKALATDEAKSAELVADRVKKMAEEGPEFFVPSRRDGRDGRKGPGGANAATAPLPTPIPADVPPANAAP